MCHISFIPPAIVRGCYDPATLTTNNMQSPLAGQFICNSFPPGVAGTITCLCDGIDCNDGTVDYTTMGGPTLAAFAGIYPRK
jgi:hypothetical protein